jgi:5-methylcytosine-specific restriction endonuclease McrA
VQIPFRLESIDVVGFSRWLRKHGAQILSKKDNSACLISFIVKNKRHFSVGDIWVYEERIEYAGAAKLNYALYLLRDKPRVYRQNLIPLHKLPAPRRLRNHDRGRKKVALRTKLVARDGLYCFYCNEKMPHNDITIEHIVPRSEGGTNDLENTVLAHSYCNNRAGTLSVALKMQLRGRILRPSSAHKRNRENERLQRISNDAGRS